MLQNNLDPISDSLYDIIADSPVIHEVVKNNEVEDESYEDDLDNDEGTSRNEDVKSSESAENSSSSSQNKNGTPSNNNANSSIVIDAFLLKTILMVLFCLVITTITTIGMLIRKHKL